MKENKKITPTGIDTVTPIKFWGTIAAAGILLLICVYFFAVLFQQPGTSVVYIGMAVLLLTMSAAVTSIVLVFRHRHELGLKLAFYALNCFVPLIILFFQGRALSASLSSLLISAIIIGWLFPRQSWRWYSAIAVAATILTWIIEWINPPWRIQMAAATIGPQAAVVFGIILVIIAVRQTWGRSMRNKLLVSFIGVTLVTAGTLAVYMYISTNNILQKNLERELAEHTTEVALSVGNLLDKQVDLAKALAVNNVLEIAVDDKNNTYAGDASAIQAVIDQRDIQWRAADKISNDLDPLVHEYLTNQAALELKKFQKSFPNHVEIFVTDVYGGLAGITDRTSDYNQADEGWWQAAYNNGEGAVYISDHEVDVGAGAHGVLIAMPIRNHETGKLIGIFRTTYLASGLNPILIEKVGNTGKFDLFFPGEVVSHYNGGLFTQVKPELFNEIQKVAAQGMAKMDYEGTPSVILQSPVQTLKGNPAVNNLGWMVVYHQNQDEALAPANAQIRGALIVMAIVLALAVAAAFGLSLFLVRPIVQLTQTAEEVAAGNLDSRAVVTGSDEIGTLASTLNNMTSQLQETLGGLEQRVAARTKALATTTEVSRRLSTILNEKELVTEVVGQVNTAFGYYHTQIYFYDVANENLVMAGGTGEAGEKMLAQGHKISKGRGLVGRAAESNETILVSDTSQNPEWLPNPLLPDTKAEIAIPISIGDEVLGVLDVQHNVTDGLQQEDVDSLQSIANQVAIAIQNTRQYRDSQQFKMGIENSGDAVFVTDIKGTITYANSTFEKVYGFALSEVIGKTPRIIKSGLLTNENYQAFWGALLSKNSVTGEIVNRHKDGQLVYIAGTNSPIVDDAGEIVGFLAVHHDITEQKKNQELAAKNSSQQQAINLITQKIQNTTSIESALQIAARELGHALGMKQTMVSLEPESPTGETKGN